VEQLTWLRASAVVAVFVLVMVAWRWTPIATMDLREISGWLEPHRHAWYALPMVMLAFIVLSLIPVLVLITATGIAFGPVLGPLYAMAGSLASASVGFAIGRWMGRRRVEQLGGKRIARLGRVLKRNGTLGVFLIRKVPVPFMLTNIVVGASTIPYRDFVVGTFLGMSAIIVALAGFGYQLTRALQDPSPATMMTTVLFVGVPLTLAWIINHALREERAAE
jgi:uncharacterized membrane protein YdjX (TVP38/TMEM64 family)